MTWEPRRAGKQICPQCSHTRKNKRDPCLSVTTVSGGFLWNCHNPGCGFKGVSDAARQAQAMDRGAGDIGRSRREARSEEHTSELQSLMRISYAVFCLKKKRKQNNDESNCNHVCNNNREET